jgi:hypothetical protein
VEKLIQKISPKVEKLIQKISPKVEIEFFDSQSAGCWNNP